MEPPPQQEIDMNRPYVFCIAALTACAVLSRPVQAEERPVSVKISVDTAGLDLGDPAVARRVYYRLQHAAFIACHGGDRVGLAPVANYPRCYEAALGNAVRSVNQPQLNAAYAAAHPMFAAAVRGFDTPARLVSK
jgi:UrcA family protein